jgi:hypothetical protein
MNGITHKQAKRYMLADLDGLLSESQRRDLETHLRDCEACRAESQSFSTLTSRLQSEFHSRWDVNDGPSKNVLKTIQSQTRRIIMSNRINLAFKALGGVAALLVLGLVINSVISLVSDNSSLANVFKTPPATLAIPAELNKETPTPEPSFFNLTVSEAENLSGFEIFEPTYLPANYTLGGVSYDAVTQRVTMQYVSQNSESSLFIYQQHGSTPHTPFIQENTTPVPVGNVEGEYIRGAWVYNSLNASTPVWDARADVCSLRWRDGEFSFSIEFLGGETAPPLSAAELVAIAESMK